MVFTTDFNYLFCAHSDVRAYSKLLARAVENVPGEEYNTISDAEIEEQIILASGQVLGMLEGYYGGPSALEETPPYVRKPTRNPNNAAEINLLKVGITTDVITETWTLKLVTPLTTEFVAFTLVGSISGNQGSGTDLADFTSTDTNIQILTTYWDRRDVNQFSAENEEIYFSTYKHKRIIVAATAMLAAGTLLISETSENSEGGSRVGSNLIKRAEKILSDLANPEKSGMTLDTVPQPNPETDMTAIAWRIDSKGEDNTDYINRGDDKDEYDIVGHF